MIVTNTVGKIDAAISRFEAPLMLYMEKEEQDNIKKSMKNEFYTVKKSKHYAEAVAGMTGIGDFVAGDGPVPYDSFEEGYSKTFTHTVFKKGIEIKRELIDDSRLIDMQNQSGALMDSWARTMEKFIHAPFNYAAATTFDMAGKTFPLVGADGLALASTAHTSKTGKTTNQSNYNATYALTEANLKLVEEQMNDFKTDIGEYSNVCPDTIVVPYELRNVAWELVQSIGKTESANNNVNPYQGKYKVVVSRWLTSATRWYLLDSVYMKKNLFWIDRIPLEINSQKDFNTENWQIKGYGRNSFGWVDWRWIIVNNT